MSPTRMPWEPPRLLGVLTATDSNSTSAGQGNTDLRHTAWINDAARLAQVIREHFKRSQEYARGEPREDR
jgi:hypothetical protein